MNPRALPWTAAIRMAWRDLRAARARFLFVVLAVAVGTGALTGVRGFSAAFRNMLLRQARTLMAGDLSARIFAMPTADQEAALRRLDGLGVQRTWITETVTMASSQAAPDPLLVSLKAVDPRVYPFYGAVTLDPAGALGDVLDAHSVAVSEDLLVRLNVRVGDALGIGGQDFRVAAVLVSEPDRMTGTLNVGPRLMMSRAGLDRTGLIGLGSRASERYLFKLPAAGGPGVERVRAALKAAFPEATIADYRQTHPTITRGLNRATTYLSLIGLIALVIGAMGVAGAIEAHLEEKLDSIAVMKCLGARSGQVMRIYTAQTTMLGLAGGLLGAALGVGVAAAFPGMIARYFTIDVAHSWSPWPAAQGIAVAVLVTLLFTWPRLAGIREIKPAEVFRRDVATPEGGRRRKTAGRKLAYLVPFLLLAGVAASLTEGDARMALRTGAVFGGGLVVGLALLAASGWAFLRGVKAFLARMGQRLPGSVRHGIANLYRPGNHAQAAVVSLGVGVMFTLSVFLVESGLVAQLRSSAPPGMPNVFLLDIPGPERKQVLDLVASQPGVEEPPEMAGAVAARLAAVDGVPLDKLDLRDWARRFRRTRSVTEMADKPPEAEVLAGRWWKPGEKAPQVCADEETARILSLRVGTEIEWNIWNRPVRTRVACIVRTESIRMSSRFEFVFAPGQLAGFPAVYYGSARVRPRDVAALQRVVYRRFPTVTVINVADVMEIVQDVVARMALVIRFISAFTILAGAIMVSCAVAGTHFRRMREVVILKTLGATRRRIAWIFSVEFLALGAVAGAVGSLLASAFSAVLLKQLLDAEVHADWAAVGITMALAALAAAGAGWAASFRVLGRKPLEILREG